MGGPTALNTSLKRSVAVSLANATGIARETARYIRRDLCARLYKYYSGCMHSFRQPSCAQQCRH